MHNQSAAGYPMAYLRFWHGDLQNYMSKQCANNSKYIQFQVLKSCKRLNAICCSCDVPWTGTGERIIFVH